MARKTVQRPKHIHRHIADWHQKWLRDKLKELEVGREQFAAYIVSVVAYDEEWKRNDALYERVEGDNPKQKDMAKFQNSLKLIERRMREMFGAYDVWQRVTNNLITVPEDEIRQIILDALTANTEAMPDNWNQLTGLERHRGFKELATDILDTMRDNGTRIEEESMDVPYCRDCDPSVA